MAIRTTLGANLAAAATFFVTLAAAHEGHDMPGMPGMSDTGSGSDTSSASTSGDSMSGSGHSMSMMSIFQTDLATSLYSQRWTPRNAGEYVGTLIFLVVLAAVLRCLLALKAIQEQRWLDRELNRRYVAVKGRTRPLSADDVSTDSLSKRAVLTENGIQEDVVVVARHGPRPRPWRLTVDPLRALIDTVIVGVGYLLMLAVMTMNVGFFVAVLVGTFIGSLVVGRYAIHTDH